MEETQLVLQDAYPRLSPKARVQADRVTGEPALLYPEGALMLNPTGAAIVALCDGKRSVREIVAALAERYAAPVEALAPDVEAYLIRLRDKLLITLNSEPTV